MLYCFVKQDLHNSEEDHPLMLQANYAKRLGSFCCCDLLNGSVTDQEGKPVGVEGERIFLRADCRSLATAYGMLARRGGVLVETADDAERIEHWDSLALTDREIVDISVADILNRAFSEGARRILDKYPFAFIKSREKGFTAQVRSSKLLRGDRDIADFLVRQSRETSGELMLTKLLHVKRDSLGRRESRHFVMRGKIVNSSRSVHSVKHTVPRAQMEKAALFVERISRSGKFPENYALDIGDFEDDGALLTDIVEINPISSALCYVNNSVFDVEVPEIAELRTRMGLGAEYCFDALTHPERYVQRRLSNVSYEYISTENHSFT